jgi:hypothetical protein
MEAVMRIVVRRLRALDDLSRRRIRVGKIAASWLALSIFGSAIAQPLRVIEEPPTLALLPIGTRLRIDAPPAPFETRLLGVDASADVLVVVEPWSSDKTTPEQRLPLSNVQGIEYRVGTNRGKTTLVGLGIGILVGGVIGGIVGAQQEPDFIFSRTTHAWMAAASFGSVGGLAGLTIGFLSGGYDWRPVDMSPMPPPDHAEVSASSP